MTLQRIEAALTRLEAAARQEPPLVSAPGPDPKLEELEAGNARLREAVAASLRRIDALIAGHDAEPQP